MVDSFLLLTRSLLLTLKFVAVQLACFKPVASIHAEPGSNSVPIKITQSDCMLRWTRSRQSRIWTLSRFWTLSILTRSPFFKMDKVQMRLCHRFSMRPCLDLVHLIPIILKNGDLVHLDKVQKGQF